MASWRSRCALLLALLTFVLCTGACSGALMAIDYGSENMKIALVAPGRTPISIVTNEMSRRKSPAAVCFNNGERLLGEDAVALAARFPGRVYLRSRDLLGKPADSAEVKELLSRLYLPYAVTADPQRGSVRLQTHTGAEFSAEELVGMVLHYARTIAEAQAKTSVRDAVITVPPSFGQAQRLALLDAAALADLNVLALVSDHTAAALQWGIDKDFSNETKTIVIFDMGANHAAAALVRYSSFPTRDGPGAKPKPVGQFEVLATHWADNAGCEALDMLLVEHFADEFHASQAAAAGGGGAPAVDVRKVPEAMAKLKKAAKRTKEILSANTAAPISVESLLPDVDFRSSVTREKLEALAAAAGLYARATAPLAALLAEGNVTADELAAVEVIGGCTRVPSVQAAISSALGGRALDKHLDADEVIAMGAGLYAANLSTTFRVRKFGAQDAAPYAIYLDVEGESAAPVGGDAPAPAEEPAAAGEEGEEAGEPTAASASTRKVLLPRWKKVPVRRIVTLNNLREGATLTLAYDESAGRPLPAGMASPQLATYTITGISNVTSKHNATGKFNAHFYVSRSGVVSLEKVEAVINITYVEQPPPPKAPVVNATAAGADGAEANATAADAGADGKADGKADAKDAKADKGKAADKEKEKDKAKAAEPAAPAPEPRLRTRSARVGVSVSAPRSSGAPEAMSASLRRASAKVMDELAEKDRLKRATEAAKNDLEAYIISTREKLGAPAWEAATTKPEREGLAAELSALEEWLYDEGEGADAAEFKSRLQKVQAKGGAVARRVAEAAAWPGAVKDAAAAVAAHETTLLGWNSTKPWLNATDKDGVMEMMKELRTWLADAAAKNAALKPHQDPAFAVADIASRLAGIKAEMTRLDRKPKPKPPVVPKVAAAKKNATAAEGEAEAKAGAGEADATGEPADKGAAGADGPEAPAGEEGAPAAAGEGAEGAAGGEEMPPYDEL